MTSTKTKHPEKWGATRGTDRNSYFVATNHHLTDAFFRLKTPGEATATALLAAYL